MSDQNYKHLLELLRVNFIEINNIKKTVSKLSSYCDVVKNNNRKIMENMEIIEKA